MKFRDQYKSLLENLNSPYGSIVKKQRYFYPRNFELSSEFIKAYQKETARLKQLHGGKPSEVLKKITKALLWLN